MLRRTANRTGCDPVAAQEMKPEYIKSILAPWGMLAYPIVVISDNQKGSKKVISRLRRDPDIGPMLRSVPKKACWLGGDMTLAVMVSAIAYFGRMSCISSQLPCISTQNGLSLNQYRQMFS